MTKVRNLSSAAKRATKEQAEDAASLEIAIAVEKRNIAKWKARIEQTQAFLKAANTRLRQLETGKVEPPKHREPKPEDHVASPPAGSFTAKPH
jgi:hypothetical protein